VKLRPGAELDADAVRAYCQGKIARYKVPRYVKFVADFPMTVTGKVRKVEMREISIAEFGLTEARTA
jgi:fatty-acyl-CoA synthase